MGISAPRSKNLHSQQLVGLLTRASGEAASVWPDRTAATPRFGWKTLDKMGAVGYPTASLTQLRLQFQRVNQGPLIYWWHLLLGSSSTSLSKTTLVPFLLTIIGKYHRIWKIRKHCTQLLKAFQRQRGDFPANWLTGLALLSAWKNLEGPTWKAGCKGDYSEKWLMDNRVSFLPRYHQYETQKLGVLWDRYKGNNTLWLNEKSHFHPAQSPHKQDKCECW